MTDVAQQEKKSDIVSVSVPTEMKVWLDKHPKINRSKVFQDTINAFRYPQPKKLSTSLMMLCFMGIVGGLVISMLAGFLYNMFAVNAEESALWWLFPIGLLMLGLALALGSFLTVMNARKNAKKVTQSEVYA